MQAQSLVRRKSPGLRFPRRLVRAVVSVAAPLALAACVSGDGGVVVGPGPVEELQPAAGGEVIGSGSVEVALLLPLTAGGSASGLAEAFRNAAAMAMEDAASQEIRIRVADTAGSDAGAGAAAEAALASGAQLVLGPVFAPAVAGAATVTRPRGVPVLAFSTDAAVAGRGVYLLSFLPRQDADRIVAYAAERGVGVAAALVPANGYGLVMEAAFREAAAREGIRVAAVERYERPDEIPAKTRSVATEFGAIEALFVPAGGGDPALVAAALAEAGRAPPAVRLLGSGQWSSRAVIDDARLAGSWFPGPAGDGFDRFARRYAALFETAPPRTAGLVYDAVSLANGLVRTQGAGRAFAPDVLTSPDGFVGVDGLFRFGGDGLSQRGLAVFEVAPQGGTTMVSPPPQRFERGGL